MLLTNASCEQLYSTISDSFKLREYNIREWTSEVFGVFGVWKASAVPASSVWQPSCLHLGAWRSGFPY